MNDQSLKKLKYCFFKKIIKQKKSKQKYSTNFNSTNIETKAANKNKLIPILQKFSQKEKMINEDSFSEEIQYCLGDVVWAKITGYPWWPAKITLLPQNTNELYRIDFFNDCTYAFLPCHKLEPYLNKRENYNIKKVMQKMLKKAIHDADEAFAASSTPRCTIPSMCSLSRPIQQQLLHESPAVSTVLQENQNLPIKQLNQTVCKIFIEQIKQQNQIVHGQLQEIKTKNEQKQIQTKTIEKIDIDKLVKKYSINRVYKILKLQTEQSKMKELKKLSNNRDVPKQKKIKRPVYHNKQIQIILCKRINSYLSHSLNFTIAQKYTICKNLANQIIALQKKPQKLVRLLKWLRLSDRQCILKYYSTWSIIEGDLQKSESYTNSPQ